MTGELAPNALQCSLLTGKNSWQPEGLESPWQELLISALVFEQEGRPGNIQEWWKVRVGSQEIGIRSQESGVRIENIPIYKFSGGVGK